MEDRLWQDYDQLYGEWSRRLVGNADVLQHLGASALEVFQAQRTLHEQRTWHEEDAAAQNGGPASGPLSPLPRDAADQFDGWRGAWIVVCGRRSGGVLFVWMCFHSGVICALLSWLSKPLADLRASQERS